MDVEALLVHDKKKISVCLNVKQLRLEFLSDHIQINLKLIRECIYITIENEGRICK